MIARSQIEELEQLPIEAVATRLGMTVERHRALCYAHEDKHPSLMFDVKRNRAKCWSCGEAVSGPIDLCMKYGRMRFREAVAYLAGGSTMIREEAEASVALDATRYGRQSEGLGGDMTEFDAARYERMFDRPCLSLQCKEWLYGVRHYQPWAVDMLRLASWKEFLVIPYYDLQMPYPRLTGIEYRYMGNDPGKPRFIFPRGVRANRMLFNLPVLNRVPCDSEIYLCEGPSDCIALTSDCKPAIAFASATLFRAGTGADMLNVLRGRNVVAVMDNDEPGEHLYAEVVKAAEMVGFALRRFDLPKQYKDYSEMYVGRCYVK